MSSTSMDHLDELRVATAPSLPLNGLAPRTYARDHAHVRGPLSCMNELLKRRFDVTTLARDGSYLPDPAAFSIAAVTAARWVGRSAWERNGPFLDLPSTHG